MSGNVAVTTLPTADVEATDAERPALGAAGLPEPPHAEVRIAAAMVHPRNTGMRIRLLT